MNDLFEVTQEVQDFVNHQKWNFCFIDGIAAQHWGEPRGTLGVDLTLLTGFGDEDLIVMKAFADRPRDWIDVESIIKRQGSLQLGWPYLESRVTPLPEAKESPETLIQLRRLK